MTLSSRSASPRKYVATEFLGLAVRCGGVWQIKSRGCLGPDPNGQSTLELLRGGFAGHRRPLRALGIEVTFSREGRGETALSG